MTRSVRAVFLDRDGVLNALVRRNGRPVSPRVPGDFRLFDDAYEALRALRSSGFRIFVVTNQPDIARGHLDSADLHEMLAIVRRELEVDDIAFCPHDDSDDCACRKPAPGMLLDLARRWNVDLRRSFMIGDSWRDVEAGRRAGCRTILIVRDGVESRDEPTLTAPDARFASLSGAVGYIHASE